MKKSQCLDGLESIYFRFEMGITAVVLLLTLTFLLCWWPFAILFMSGNAAKDHMLLEALATIGNA